MGHTRTSSNPGAGGSTRARRLIWPVAGVFQQPEDPGTCKISSDANQFLYTAAGEFTGTGTLKRWPMSAVGLVSPPFKVIDSNVSAFYADQSNGGIYSDEMTKVTRFDPAGEPVEVFGDGDLSNSTGVAANSISGTVYAADRGTNDVKIYTAVTTPDITNVGATTGQHKRDALRALDTAGAGNVTGCEVEYGTGPTYGATEPCSGSLPITSGHGRDRESHGLAVETEYHYRVRATNANGTTGASTEPS